MTYDQPSFVPVYLLAMLAGLFFSLWSGLIDGLSKDLRDLACVFGIITFAGMCAMGGGWAIHEMNFIVNQDEILEAAIAEARAREAEAIGKYNDRQIELSYNLHGFAPENVSGKDFILLDDGTAVERDAILQISRNANGLNLRPENQYTANQPAVRFAHDALNRVGAIETGRGSRGPRIRDDKLFEAIVEMAKHNGRN